MAKTLAICGRIFSPLRRTRHSGGEGEGIQIRSVGARAERHGGNVRSAEGRQVAAVVTAANLITNK